MSLPWTFDSQPMEILLDSVTDDQAAIITVRTIPYSGGSSKQFVVDYGGIGPETIAMSLWFDSADDYTSFRATVLGVQGALNWMLGTVPNVMLKSLSLKTLHRPTGYPVEVDAQFDVVSPITGSGSTSHDTAYPWSFTPTGGSAATFKLAYSPSVGDEEDTEVSLRMLAGSGSGPSWFTDWGPSGAEMITLALSFDSASDFLNFRLALLGTAGALAYPVSSVTLALLTRMSITKVFPAPGYPVLATAEFLVITP